MKLCSISNKNILQRSNEQIPQSLQISENFTHDGGGSNGNYDDHSSDCNDGGGDGGGDDSGEGGVAVDGDGYMKATSPKLGYMNYLLIYFNKNKGAQDPFPLYCWPIKQEDLQILILMMIIVMMMMLETSSWQ